MLRMEIPKEANTEALTRDLDMTNELCEAVVMHMVSYQQRITNFYNSRVRQRAYKSEDLVLIGVFENTADPITSKFQPIRKF